LLNNYLFLTYFLMFLLGCMSEVSVDLNSEKSTPAKKIELIASEYELGSPNFYSTNSSLVIDFELTRILGNTKLDESKFSTSLIGTTNCDDLKFLNTGTNNPIVRLENCNGNGRVSFNYGIEKSEEVLVNNGNSLEYHSPEAIALNSTGTMAYMASSSLQAIYSTELLNGEINLLSSVYEKGSGDPMLSPVDIVLSNDEDKAYFIGYTALFELDVATGSRSIVSNNSVGDGVNYTSLGSLIVNNAETYAYTLDKGLDALFQINLSNGDRVIISDATTGTGTPFGMPNSLIINSAETIGYVLDSNPISIIRVDLITGNRTIVTDLSTGNNSTMLSPKKHVLSLDETKIYFIDDFNNNLIEVEISTGKRTMISSELVGTGINLGKPKALAMMNDGESVVYASTSPELLLKINLTSGNRSIIKKESTNRGETVYVPKDINYVPGSSFIYIIENRQVVKVEISSGNTTVISSNTIGTGPSYSGLSAGFIDEINKKMYLTDSSNDALYFVDMTNGNRVVVSDDIIGTGTNFSSPVAVSVNNARTLAYVLDSAANDSVVEVNLSNGDRTIISNNGTGSGTTFNSPKSLILNSAEDTAYVVDQIRECVFSINLSNGNRTYLSHSSRGSGVNLDAPKKIFLNSDESYMYVSNRNTGDPNGFITRIDMTNGNRNIVSSNSIGEGFALYNPSSLVILAGDTEAYVIEDNHKKVTRVDLSNGDRFGFIK
jgi:hypothetical protein